MNVCRYFAAYRYRPPMPLEDVSNHYFYCTPGGLPPLAPRKKNKVTIIVINDKSNDNNNIINNNNNNNNVIINTPPASTAVPVPTVPTDVDSLVLEEEASTTCWWGWTIYYWFMHTYPRWYKFFGLIYLFLVDFFTGKDWVDAGDDNDNNIINNINVTTEVVEEEDDEDEWIHGENHTGYHYYDDEVPFEDEFAPPEAEELVGFEALRQLLLPQQEEEPTTTSSNVVTAIADVPHYDLDDDDDEDDDGSDYYFSLPSESTNNSFIAIGVPECDAGEEVTFGMTEEPIAMEINDVMPVLEAFDAIEDVVDVTLVAVDVTEDVEASKSIDQVSTSAEDTAALGSIWVPNPKYGMVRRSARLRLRG
jgi:hypothetical protein